MGSDVRGSGIEMERAGTTYFSWQNSQLKEAKPMIPNWDRNPSYTTLPARIAGCTVHSVYGMDFALHWKYGSF